MDLEGSGARGFGSVWQTVAAYGGEPPTESWALKKDLSTNLAILCNLMSFIRIWYHLGATFTTLGRLLESLLQRWDHFWSTVATFV